MDSYKEIMNSEGVVVSTIKRNPCGIIEVYKVDSGVTAYIANGKLLFKKDKDMKFICPEPSAPEATEEELKAHLQRIKELKENHKSLTTSNNSNTI